jgi:tripartite-type tricarboxylate transporter receptor subunit TctC
VERQFVARGLEPVLNTPEEFRAYLDSDRVRAQHIIKESGLAVQ